MFIRTVDTKIHFWKNCWLMLHVFEKTADKMVYVSKKTSDILIKNFVFNFSTPFFSLFLVVWVLYLSSIVENYLSKVSSWLDHWSQLIRDWYSCDPATIPIQKTRLARNTYNKCLYDLEFPHYWVPEKLQCILENPYHEVQRFAGGEFPHQLAYQSLARKFIGFFCPSL